MGFVKKILQLSRAHTAPLETVPAFIGAYLVTGQLTLLVGVWTFFGFFYHITGYTQNSVADYFNGHDKDDPHKEHHPLNGGTKAFQIFSKFLADFLLLGIVIYTLVVIYLSPSGRYGILVGIAIIGAISGVVYNMYSKKTNLKFIPISIAHTSVFVIPYISMGGELNTGFFYTTSFMLLWITFQIAISGELKDITADETNLLKTMGSEVYEDDYGGKIRTIQNHPSRVILTAFTIRLLLLVLATGMVFYYSSGLDSLAITTALMTITGGVIVSTLIKRLYFRDVVMRNISAIEGLTLFTFIISLSGVLGWRLVGYVMAASVLWLVVMNKIEWGTFLSPKV